MRRTSLTGGVRAKTGAEQERGTRGKQDEGSAAPKYRRPRTARIRSAWVASPQNVNPSGDKPLPWGSQRQDASKRWTVLNRFHSEKK